MVVRIDMNDVACVVHPIGRSDLEALVSMCAEHALYEQAQYDAAGKAAALERALFGLPARLTAWMAQVHGKAVGYAAASNEFSTWSACEYLHMDCLYVRDGYRGLGIGATLLTAVVGYARQQGYAEVQWQTPDWNVAAAHFYLREGAIGKAKLRFSLKTHTLGVID